MQLRAARFLKFTLVCLALLVGAAAVFLATLDLNRYKTEIGWQLERVTGRSVTLGGDIRFALSLLPTVVVEDVSVANASWGKAPHLAHVGRFEARVGLLEILSGQLAVSRLSLEQLELMLETDARGQGNWEREATASAPAQAPAASEAARVALHEVELKDIRFSYSDGVTGAKHKAVVELLSLVSTVSQGPLQLELTATVNDLPLRATGTVSPFAELMANRPYSVDLDGTLHVLDFKLTGMLPEPLTATAAEFRFDVNLPSLADLNIPLDMKLPKYGPLRASGLLSTQDSILLSISDLKLNAAQSDLTGGLTLNRAGARPALAGQLHSTLIDLTPFLPPEQASTKKPAYLFSRQKLSVAGLRKLDIDVQLAVDKLKARRRTFEQVSLPLKLADGKLSLAPLTALEAGGRISLNLRLDAGSDIPALEGDFTARQLELAQLPRFENVQHVKDGRTDVDATFKGKGGSVAEIMGGLNGKILVQVGKGRIPNSLAGLTGSKALLMETFARLNPVSTEPSSELECAVINFQITDGMAKTDKGIAVQTPSMNLVGSGAVNLKTEQLDVAIRPISRGATGLGVGAVAGAARIGGTLVEPRAVVDAANVLQAGATAGAAVMTFGISTLAQGLFEKVTADPNPCTTALGKGPAAKPAPAPAKQPEAPRQAESTPAPVKKATEAVKGVLESIFGN